jgi:hypothetical protein
MAEVHITVVDREDMVEIYTKEVHVGGDEVESPTPAQTVASYMFDAVGGKENAPNSGFAFNMAKFVQSFVRQSGWRTTLIFWLMDASTYQAFEKLGDEPTGKEIEIVRP